ncbi:MAG: hypothetical protein ACFB0A_12115 [Croceivirga sp.]
MVKVDMTLILKGNYIIKAFGLFLSFAADPDFSAGAYGSHPKSILIPIRNGLDGAEAEKSADFKKLKISLDFFVSFLGNAKKKRTLFIHCC